MFYRDRVFLPVGENTDPPNRDKLPVEAEDMLNEIDDLRREIRGIDHAVCDLDDEGRAPLLEDRERHVDRIDDLKDQLELNYGFAF